MKLRRELKSIERAIYPVQVLSNFRSFIFEILLILKIKFQIPAQVLKIHFLGVSLSQPQLPTVPVPPASLAAVTAAGRVNIGGLQQPLVTVTSASVAGGVAVGGTGPQISQLAAQLARPSASGQGTLPTYSQAVGAGVTSIQSVSQLQTSPLRRPPEAASPHLTSPGAVQSQLRALIWRGGQREGGD